MDILSKRSRSQQFEFWKKYLPKSFFDTYNMEVKGDGEYLFWSFSDKNGKVDIDTTLKHCWELFQNTFNTWQSTNIFCKEKYRLYLLNEKEREVGFYTKRAIIDSRNKGKSILELSKTNNSFLAHEVLQLLFLYYVENLEKEVPTLNYYFYLADVRLLNALTEHDLERSLCFYKVDDYFVLDRVGIEYEIPWNNVITFQ